MVANEKELNSLLNSLTSECGIILRKSIQDFFKKNRDKLNDHGLSIVIRGALVINLMETINLIRKSIDDIEGQRLFLDECKEMLNHCVAEIDKKMSLH